MIISCTCVNKFQDKRYGKSKRVYTHCKENKARCTVCLRMQDVKKDVTP
jgi:hypothetical protein